MNNHVVYHGTRTATKRQFYIMLYFFPLRAMPEFHYLSNEITMSSKVIANKLFRNKLTILLITFIKGDTDSPQRVYEV
jgi:hypothetical protein